MTHCPECRKPLRDYHKANCSHNELSKRKAERDEIVRELRKQLVPNLDPFIEVVTEFVCNVEGHTILYSGVTGNAELYAHLQAFKIRLEELK